MRMVVELNGKPVPKDQQQAVLLEASRSFHDSRLRRRLAMAEVRHQHSPERHSVAVAMMAVEERLVKAFWTIARQPVKRMFPGALAQCGLAYMPERGDLNGYSDAAGGKWQSVAPRPPVPCGKEIDQANEALDWLLLVDERRRKLLVAGATSKRGDAGRQIAWNRIRLGMPELHGLTTTTLKRHYQDALRSIVTELTLARVCHLG